MSDDPATKDDAAEPDVDAERMLRVGQGDQQALREIIEHWQGPMINFFYRSLRSVEASEDLAQMVFIRIYRAAERYQPTAKFSTYLFHIARRVLINEFRRQSRKPLDSMDPADLQASTPGRDKLQLMELEEAFAQALETLPENQRTAILLLKQQQLSYEEIALTMEASEAAVKSWIHRARQKLKDELADFYRPE
ncbi:RNA polymerase sigma factor [Cerasicoccus arenae]|uniref:RNA polymerase sigma factor n=1 Tax=Cerasicoccus arenae TaxID=424488 RepID=A0A8J3DAG6_9BACT|nr:RNA polymerase sigma factor [Cerasicoccus arenae]MBK1858158.1 RNA polymerase sigma factor [Cerasicoccus arenae]GHB96843.1 RNA polymerase sigma factor [Cerasicoccus arenae]